MCSKSPERDKEEEMTAPCARSICGDLDNDGTAGYFSCIEEQRRGTGEARRAQRQRPVVLRIIMNENLGLLYRRFLFLPSSFCLSPSEPMSEGR